jgi:DNA-binding transcriptional MerR regulator
VDETGTTAPGRRANKPASAFRTIGEAAEELDLPAHVLRFWESKFPQLKPLKRGGGRRYYRPEDMALLRRIRQCLYQEGYTIRGVQKLLNGKSKQDADTAAVSEDPASPTLFPLEPLPNGSADTADTGSDAKPARSSPARRFGPDMQAELAQMRHELLEAKALIDRLIGGRKSF